MKKMETTTRMHIELYQQMRIAQHFDFDTGFELLKELFAMRKKVAVEMDKNYTEELKQYFHYINNKIGLFLGV